MDQRALTVLGYPHQPDGSGWYRYFLPFKNVARYSDHHIALPPPVNAKTGKFEAYIPHGEDLEQLDVISVQRFLNPPLMREWQAAGVAVIYETDDDILHPDQASGLSHMFDPDVHAAFIECIEAADMVTVSTAPLAEQMSKYNETVRLIPNHVDGNLLYMERRHAERLTIGWAGGISHLGDWASVISPVNDVMSANPEVDLHLIGWDFSPMLQRKARFTPWKPNVWDYYKGIDFDIGVAPLVDTAFNDSKSHIKALEYAALGIPIVASNLAPYRDFVVDGETGFLVNDSDEWVDRLEALIRDEDLRAEMGAAAKARAEQFVVQRGWRLWANAFEEAAK